MNARASTLTVLDLFSGIGMFALGLERAGMQVITHCENEPYPAAVLRKRFPGIPNLGDITQAEFPNADVIAAGFPCQDLSNAGKRAGLSGERSGLWREVVRAVRVVRPRVVLLENVAALLSRGMGKVVGDLAQERYDAEWDRIPATAVGLPHRRLRIWIAAYPQRNEQSRQEPRCGTLGRVGRFLEPLPAHGDWKTSLAEIRGEDDGRPRSVDRTDTLRNTIVPQIPEAIGRAILSAMAENPCLSHTEQNAAHPVAPAAISGIVRARFASAA